MDTKESYIQIFADTERMIRTNPHLFKAMEESRENTILYTPDKEIPTPSTPRYKTKIVISRKRTAEAASSYRGEKVALLNFASGWKPGGGVKKGSSAQEESLCRISTLYPVLASNRTTRPFYNLHHELANTDFTDAIIYSPNVTFFKFDNTFPTLMPESEWYSASVISAAAPRLRRGEWEEMPKTRQTELENIFDRRIRRILKVAASNGIDVLVLGAFGCGAYHNPPEMVASAFKSVLADFEGAFKSIEFAIYAQNPDDRNFQVFNQILSSCQE